MNRAFSSPVVETAKGGPSGGTTVPTPLGVEVIRRYRTIEAIASASARAEIASLLKLLRS
jgi:molybdate transport system regulatory protein